MVCTRCSSEISDCSCPDRDASLKTIAMDPHATGVLFKWCRICDKHYARCKCETPDFYLLSGGQEIPVYGLRDITGKLVNPDVLRRR